MENIGVTSVSSKGQIVIPQRLREKLKIRVGERFIVVGEKDEIVLKKIGASFSNRIDKLLNKTREFAKGKGLKESDIEEAVRSLKKR